MRVKHKDILEQTLLMCLEICQKSLNYDCTSIMLNDTIEDSASTNVRFKYHLYQLKLPITWGSFVKDQKTITNMFKLLNLQFYSQQWKERIKVLAL